MKNFKTDGIVIKRRNYGEADRIITLLTKDHGKLQVKAKGIRKITSRRSPHVELLNYTQITVYKGKAYPILIEAQMKEDYAKIKRDLQKIGLAYHICELVDGLCPENQENEAVFNLLRKTLSELEVEQDLLAVIHEFEIELLTILGYWHDTLGLTAKLDTGYFIENIIERKLKSKSIFAKLE